MSIMQKVFHLHFHVIPRHEGDGYRHWHGEAYANQEEIKKMGEGGEEGVTIDAR